ncbi:MAG: DUF2795 domain-containing protein [Streptomyces sp.]|uniref:DUF2795 domain-containing protein n=1 Tax=Streptomyces sp. B93 TaxID=2824875 RepID=UPI0019953E1D|nr:DUF2795 domain-containing protein [Streptomyces sp. B93]MBC7271378.1 DUF2795 domain-containing protein [Streptomyces sp.]MBQ1088864.1 DUF2795 domain-containing protein [Streptomyces sp. B93]
MDRTTSAQDVVKAVRDADFPAGKDELVDAAKRAGASHDVVAALRGMPRESYANREEVARSVRVAPDSDLGLSEAQRAEQARKGGRPGQSQHLREVPKPPVQDELEP